ncbi:hypothetical protein [Mycolicibacterium peregrinum]|uniref:hypothetical protein n=1 Tax=Mycolicibacterium peregrinum TaxID=43304 RepID=UPI003AAFF446
MKRRAIPSAHFQDRSTIKNELTVQLGWLSIGVAFRNAFRTLVAPQQTLRAGASCADGYILIFAATLPTAKVVAYATTGTLSPEKNLRS